MTEQAADTGGAEAALRGKVQRVGLLSDGGIPNLSPRIKLQSSEGGDTLVHWGRRIACLRELSFRINIAEREKPKVSPVVVACVGVDADLIY